MHHRDFTQNIIQLLVRVRNKKTRKLAGYIFRDKKQKQNCTFYNLSLKIFTFKNTPSDNTKKGQRDSENLKVFVTNFLINRPTNRLTGEVREIICKSNKRFHICSRHNIERAFAPRKAPPRPHITHYIYLKYSNILNICMTHNIVWLHLAAPGLAPPRTLFNRHYATIICDSIMLKPARN